MNQKGLKSVFPDRPELCRRQGHAGRRRLHLQGKVVGRIDDMAGTARFSAELAKAKAAKRTPSSVFYPARPA